MPCEVWLSDEEADSLVGQLDPELRELLIEVNNAGGQYFVESKECQTGFLRKRTEVSYSLFHKIESGRYQLINFGPRTKDGNSLGFVASRQAIAGYLFGYLNGRSSKATEN